MCAVSNYDIFVELFELIKNPDTDIAAVLKEHGGSSIYVPSFKSICRNDEIILKYKENMSTANIKIISRDYDLSVPQVYAITKEVREPTLF